MLSRKEYEKKFREKLKKGLPTWDTEENIQKYIDGIDFDDYYKAFLIELNSDIVDRTEEGIISADVYNLYMLYPDY